MMKKKTVIYGLILVGVLSGVFLISEKKKDSKIVTVKTSIAAGRRTKILYIYHSNGEFKE